MGIHLLKWTVAVGVFFSLQFNHGTRGAVIVFKDGFVIRGEVKQPTKVEVVETVFQRPDGLMYVDDLVRRVVFPPTGAQLCEVLKDDPVKVNNLLYFFKDEVAPRIKRLPMPIGYGI